MLGEFSSSSRVTTFLSTVSRYRVHIRHIDGVANLPSYFGSRNPCECQNCQCFWVNIRVSSQWNLLSDSKLWCVRQMVAPHPGALMIEATHVPKPGLGFVQHVNTQLVSHFRLLGVCVWNISSPDIHLNCDTNFIYRQFRINNMCVWGGWGAGTNVFWGFLTSA